MRTIRSSLGRDQSGVTIVEFGLIAPVLMAMLLGTMDMAYNIYTASILRGTIQRAARASTIEGASMRHDKIDAAVTEAVHMIVPEAEVGFARTAYASFSEINRAEDYSDIDASGSCDNGEPFEDANRNGRWDNDRGTAGQGGARDAVLYRVTVRYPRVFAAATFVGLPETVSTESTSVLRNQPFDLQHNAPTTGNCT